MSAGCCLIGPLKAVPLLTLGNSTVHELADRGHGQLGGHFAARVATHAIGDDVKRKVVVNQEAVLVVVPAHPDIGLARGYDLRRLSATRLPRNGRILGRGRERFQ